MPTMILKQEIEATPDLVAAELRKFADTMKSQKFPWNKGDLLKLQNSYLRAIGGMENMPVLVLASSLGTPLGMIAVHKADGNITMAYINGNQVESVWEDEVSYSN